MKNLIKRAHFALYILLTCVVCVGCANNKDENIESYVDDIYAFYKDEKWINSETEIKDTVTMNYNKAIGKNVKKGRKLEPHQLAFIEKCKKEGKSGCTLTIDNQQIYVSFYHCESCVGNAR